ncbi:hypothetical protein KL933_004274 [Ogataea haglerorum]|uniref:DNA-binding protein REB1 n=1 Tax=Ogataea haglerorum TaxID=1937702 RepID=A0AAN6D2E9_9ASCO|nr:uncharacterized protein KL911_004837 [Ogataea haglerorum]KAG7692768.1 hypothetical protein KL951_004779 [Ogataea haglerorum]KAG7715575.1 hypothetical protein KL913_003910 [Ogataea haglerorum]KAG7716097.1 hypothetical protein KL949_003992 [Ogataea haglerorum]KAG7725260.1 hypothetical protein KL933_004274 [Ogataea haglerorum]KAG7727332.1 hypothetical protein KL948_004481 [Ogataea haglerorum]
MLDQQHQEAQEQIGGARALLELGTKQKEGGDQNNDVDQQSKHDEEDEPLDRSRKRNFSNDDDMSQLEFQQWTTGFLADDLEGQEGDNDADGYHFGNQSGLGIPSLSQNSSKRPKKTSRKDTNGVSGRNSAPSASNVHAVRIKNINVDPELANLDTSSFVQDAMIDARTLASLGSIDHEYLRHAAEGAHSESAEDEVQHLAVQAVNQAVAAAQAQANAVMDKNDRQSNGEAHDRKHLPTPPLQSDSQQDRSGSRGLTPSGHQFSVPSAETAALVAEAAEKARSYVTVHSQGRSFSKEESNAIDLFITEYQNINNMSREEICKRIWSNERKKDDFWESLQKVLPERTRASLYKHVRRTYHIFNVRGKWSPEDDERLAQLAAKMEGQWKEIGKEMNRMPEDCRDRWRNYVKCGNNRLRHKWSLEEEDKLRTVIHGMLREQTANSESMGVEPVINWTLVSERMGGTRSRIQCRYKWNKLVKREAGNRARSVDLETRNWLLARLREIWNREGTDSIDWDTLASLHPSNVWSGVDFKKCFEKMKSTVPGYKKKPFIEIVDTLLQENTENYFDSENKSEDKKKEADRPDSKKPDAEVSLSELQDLVKREVEAIEFQ